MHPQHILTMNLVVVYPCLARPIALVRNPKSKIKTHLSASFGKAKNVKKGRGGGGGENVTYDCQGSPPTILDNDGLCMFFLGARGVCLVFPEESTGNVLVKQGKKRGWGGAKGFLSACVKHTKSIPRGG